MCNLRRGITGDAGKRLHDWAVAHGLVGERSGKHVRYTHPKIPGKCVIAPLTSGSTSMALNMRGHMRKAMLAAGFPIDQTK